MGELPADKVVYFEAREGQEQILQLWEDMDIRLEVVGASGVGKSALILQFYACDISEYAPTIDESCRQDVTLKVVGSRSPGYKVFVDILDTRGDEYSSWHDYEQSMHGFLLCFDSCDRSSLEYLKSRVLRLICNNKPPPMVLVATKCDREDQAVTRAEATQLAQSISAPYYETSAFTGTGVADAFSELIRRVVNTSAVKPEQKTYCCMM